MFETPTRTERIRNAIACLRGKAVARRVYPMPEHLKDFQGGTIRIGGPVEFTGKATTYQPGRPTRMMQHPLNLGKYERA
jgi:hypothetical protein